MTELPTPNDHPPAAPDEQNRATVSAPPSPNQDVVTRTAFPSLLARTATHTPNGPVLHALPDAPPGYELLGELGRGGMGVVYRARQLSLNREVALKVILAGEHASAQQRQRFVREAAAAAALSHPGVVHVYEVGEHRGLPYLALELCNGGTLAERFEGTPLPASEAATLVEELAQTVQAAHEKGIVHRDIKPANILLTTNGTPKVADFGLAKVADTGDWVTATGAVFGTPSYMAPEQARGDTKAVGPAADVYALGAVLYECLTGRPPFKAASTVDTLNQVLHQEPVPVRALNPVVRVDLETVCLKCLEKDAAKRYLSARALADDLQAYLDGRPVTARRIGPLGRMWRWVRRNPVVAAAIAAVSVSLLTGAVVSYVQYLAADWARDQAVGEAAAREQALARLSEETAAKDAALRDLTAEKTATEDALLDGLLRALRSTTMNESEAIRPEEVDALSALAVVPSERLRFRFVERALRTRVGAAKVAAMRTEVVWAVVGLDQAAAVRLRDLASRPFEKDADPEVLLACALLAEALPPGNATLDARAAQVVLDRLFAENDVRVRRDLAVTLHSLARRLGPADALALSHSVTDRLDIEQDHIQVAEYAGLLSALAPRVGPAAAGRLAQSLVERMTVERHSYARHFLAEAVAAAAWRLTSAEAGELARMVADRAKTETDSYALGGMGRAVGALAGRLHPSDAAGLCGPLARTLAGRAVAGSNQGDASFLADGLAGLAAHLDPKEAAAVCGPPARTLMNEIVESRPAVGPGSRRPRLAALARRMDQAEADQYARALAERMEGEPNPYRLANLTQALSALAGRLGQSAANEVCGPAARKLAGRIASEKDSISVAWLAEAARGLSEVIGPRDAGPLVRSLVDRLLRLADANARSSTAAAVAALAERLDSAEASEMCGPLAKALAARATAEGRSTELVSLSDSVGRLAGLLDRREAAHVCGPFTQLLARRVAAAQERADVANLAVAASNLVKGMDDTEVVEMLRSYGLFRDIQRSALAELGLRCAPQPVLALAAGPASVVSLRTPQLTTVWEFADWAEKNRPDLDLKSRSRKLEVSAAK